MAPTASSSVPRKQPAASIVVPGTLVDIAGTGVLLSGESGTGKSDTVLGLLDRGHRLIADDAVELYRQGKRLRGRCPTALRGIVAIRGIGAFDVRTMFGDSCVRQSIAIDLQIALEPRAPAADALAVELDVRSIMDLAIPHLRLPAAGGRNLPLLLEAAVKVHAAAGRRRSTAVAGSHRVRASGEGDA